VILLDTDHLTALKYVDSERCRKLQARLDEADDDVVGTTIVNVEEQMRGWLAAVAREKDLARQVSGYRELAGLFRYFDLFEIALFDDRAADRAKQLRANKIRIGTMDLKIASIALVNDALLLSANLQHFEKAPGLRVENWLD
jgi:tRNA(fMet)-specific endonuclease VapC